EGDVRDTEVVRVAPEHVAESVRKEQTEVLFFDEASEEPEELRADEALKRARTRDFNNFSIDQLKPFAGDLGHVPEFFSCHQLLHAHANAPYAWTFSA